MDVQQRVPSCPGRCQCGESCRQSSYTISKGVDLSYQKWRLPDSQASLMQTIEDPATDLGAGGLCALVTLMLAQPFDTLIQKAGCACLLKHPQRVAIMMLSWQVVVCALHTHDLVEAFVLLLDYALQLPPGYARSEIMHALLQALSTMEVSHCLLPSLFGDTIQQQVTSETSPQRQAILLFGLRVHLKSLTTIRHPEAFLALSRQLLSGHADPDLSRQCASLCCDLSQLSALGASAALPAAIVSDLWWLATEHVKDFHPTDRDAVVVVVVLALQHLLVHQSELCESIGEVLVAVTLTPSLGCKAQDQLLQAHQALLDHTFTFAEPALALVDQHSTCSSCCRAQRTLRDWPQLHPSVFSRPALASSIIGTLCRTVTAQEVANTLVQWHAGAPAFVQPNAQRLAEAACLAMGNDFANDQLRRTTTMFLLDLIALVPCCECDQRVMGRLIASWRAELDKWVPDAALITALQSRTAFTWRPGLDPLFPASFCHMADHFLITARLHLQLPTEVIFVILSYVQRAQVSSFKDKARLFASKMFGNWSF